MTAADPRTGPPSRGRGRSPRPRPRRHGIDATGHEPDAAERALRARLEALTLRDARRLQRRLDGLRKARDRETYDRELTKLTGAIEAAERRVEQRRAAVPEITYPEALPVSERKDDILAAIRDSQVVIVAGETGSGKTTQIPKICLELGRGVRGLIGHTQPRRIAARTVADRIAEELGTPLGATVGYKVRFTDEASDQTLVKLMTDGILLAEIQNDRDLLQYDTLIIDEAHERSLNIDFILGYLKQLLPRRPDLKVVITSATIDPERFARHFDDAPVVEVSGRTYPVEVRYRPYDEDDRDEVQAICDAVEELWTEGPGDVLVFLSGEREIRDTADALRGMSLPDTEILPLYARLSAAEQHRVFQAHSTRRVVLATNVAETSLTVPGIRYVVDPGSARISRYSLRLKVQRLPIEPISQASANQRKGRCGRVSEGTCIRLYSEEDFLGRPEFTDPEILRTNLASVILQMTALGLGDVAAFPFLEPPDRRQVRDGMLLLHELGALDPDEPDPRKRLTPLGRKLAQLPLDPRLGRMVLEADRNGCVREVLIIAAALSIQDPRERPVEHQQAADQQHARFADKESDFLGYVNLWNYLREQQRELSSNQFRKLCRAEYLNYLRVREWQDILAQLRQLLKPLDMTLNSTPALPDSVHLSLLAGLLSHLGLKDVEKQEYVGARGARFALWPGSALAKKRPQWVMAAELVETSRLWARVCARVQPEWAEQLGAHLVKRNYSEPHWEKDRGAVMAYEKVTLYGVPIVAQRKVSYGKVDPELSRELFIRHALVEGDWRTHHKFWHENRSLLREVEELEHRVRRRDILVDDEALFEFYEKRIPPHVVSAQHFDAWWKKARHEDPDLLNFSKSLLVADESSDVSERDHPDVWPHGDLSLRLTYRFEPGAPDDGVTVHVPVAVLNRLDGAEFLWQVRGLREELVTALIRALPKPVRKNFVPAPNFARAVLERLTPYAEPVLDALERELRRMSGVEILRSDWDLSRVPAHLLVTFRVVDEKGRTLAQGKDLDVLKSRLRPKVRQTVAQAAVSIERTGLLDWTFGELSRTFETRRDGLVVRGFPALVDEGATVAVRVLASEADQQRVMWRGVRRLLLLNCPSPVKSVVARLNNADKLALGASPYPSVPVLLGDCVVCAADALMERHGGIAWDEASYRGVLDKVRADLHDTTYEVVTGVARILATAQAIEKQVKAVAALPLLPSLTEIREHVASLVHNGFVSATGAEKLPDLVRYLQADERRLDKLVAGPGRDRQLMAQFEQVRREYDEWLLELTPARRDSPEVTQIRWMLEELRVSYFAQQLGTPYPISEKRIYRAMDTLTPLE